MPTGCPLPAGAHAHTHRNSSTPAWYCTVRNGYAVTGRPASHDNSVATHNRVRLHCYLVLSPGYRARLVFAELMVSSHVTLCAATAARVQLQQGSIWTATPGFERPMPSVLQLMRHQHPASAAAEASSSTTQRAKAQAREEAEGKAKGQANGQAKGKAKGKTNDTVRPTTR